MAIITTNGSFGATAAVTSTTLNNIANAATFDDPVDGTSLELKSDGKLGIKDAGVTAAIRAYPVGSIYMNATVATNPGTLLGFGTWVAFSTGRILLGVGEGTDNQPTPEVKTFALGDELGQYKHTLLEDEMPSHNHTWTGDRFGVGYGNGAGVATTNTQSLKSTIALTSSGGGLAHNNIQPYIAVHMWKRTA